MAFGVFVFNEVGSLGGRRRHNFRHPSYTWAHPDDLQESRFSVFLTVFSHFWTFRNLKKHVETQ